jgi:hypothetical protein
MTVLALPTTSPTLKARAPRRVSRAAQMMRVARKYGPGIGLGSVIATLLGLSLTDLSEGIQLVSGCAPWKGTAMAVGLDCLLVATEVVMVTTLANRKLNRAVAKFAHPIIAGVFTWSAALNALAFGSGAPDSWMHWMTVAAASLGASIPALIYAATRVWSAVAIKH